MISLVEPLKKLLADVVLFVRHGTGLQLRSYQIEIALAVVDSVIHRRGLTFVVVISRQAGKNELQAQLESYLLLLFSLIGFGGVDAEMVKASPTFKPQTQNAMRRLRRVLKSNVLTKGLWKPQDGYIYRIGRALIVFLSAQKEASVVGATANILLECDEGQHVSVEIWDERFAPMGASGDPTVIIWGTEWTNAGLLAREEDAALVLQQRDGIKRVFRIDADAVGAEVEAYRRYVEKQIQKLGRNHPLIQTQYFLQRISAKGGMFPEARRELMVGDHPRRRAPEAGKIYAFILDVAGEDEDAEGAELREREPRKDSTFLTIVEVDLSTMRDELIAAPTYRVVDRWWWTGTKHSSLYGKIKALVDLWNPRYVVGDATGVGAGLASFFIKALPGRFIPFIFSLQSKSQLGWDFIAVVETGRFKDWKRAAASDESDLFWKALEFCQYQVLPVPGKVMKWGVPDGTRDPQTGEIVHDDALSSAALVAELDKQEWIVGYTFMPGVAIATGRIELVFCSGVLLIVQQQAVGFVVIAEVVDASRPDQLLAAALEMCAAQKWPRPDLLLADPGASEIRKAARRVNVAARGEKVTDEADVVLRRLLSTSLLTVSDDCTRLKSELGGVSGVLVQALQLWVWNRGRRL